ncbi:hypothetical protein KM043_005753 [Ampulex compressa]|nr:hypothetical protein KM043_005753 [Ampulex compressa]
MTKGLGRISKQLPDPLGPLKTSEALLALSSPCPPSPPSMERHHRHRGALNLDLTSTSSGGVTERRGGESKITKSVDPGEKRRAKKFLRAERSDIKSLAKSMKIRVAAERSRRGEHLIGGGGATGEEDRREEGTPTEGVRRERERERRETSGKSRDREAPREKEERTAQKASGHFADGARRGGKS